MQNNRTTNFFSPFFPATHLGFEKVHSWDFWETVSATKMESTNNQDPTNEVNAKGETSCELTAAATNDGIKVGAFSVPVKHLQIIIQAEKERRQLDRWSVTPFRTKEEVVTQSATTPPQEVMKAVHTVGPPDEAMLELVHSVGGSYHPGIRVFDEQCHGSAAYAKIHSQEVEAARADLSRCGGSSPSVPFEAKKEGVAPFTFVELFAGIGGFRLGMEAHGGRCVFASELSTSARKVYFSNFGEWPAGDITHIPAELIPDHDVLTAGFPCQSFCVLGNKQGLKDISRGALFAEVLRVLHCKKPKCFLLENVENILHIDGGFTFQVIEKALVSEGYKMHCRVINSKDYLPQTRNRVYFVGIRADVAGKFKFRWPEPPADCKCLREILETSPDPSLNLTPTQLKAVRESVTFKSNPLTRVADLDGTSRTLMSRYHTSHRIYSEFVPLMPDPTSHMTSAETDEKLQPLRFFSLRECGRLMGFPDSFRLSPHPKIDDNFFYRLLGNAVCPPVIAAVAEMMLPWLIDTAPTTK